MTYAQVTLQSMIDALPGEDVDLIRLYALLALTRGEQTTLSDVHDAWALWRMQTHPQHHSIIPFADLADKVRELDRPYMDAIHAVARKLNLE